MKIALMWASTLDHDYSHRNFEYLYKSVGHNTGNVAFVHAIKKLVKIDEIALSWNEVAKSSSDLLVFPAANQLGKHTDLGDLAARIAQSAKPIVAIGLGAQSEDSTKPAILTEGTKSWLEVLVKQRPTELSNIWTRGSYTTKQIETLVPGFNPTTGCCPSLFINVNPRLGLELSQIKPKFQRIAIAAGNIGFRDMKKLESQLASLVSDSHFPGIYITQSMGEMIQLGLGQFGSIDPTKLEQMNRYIAPWLSEEEFMSWCKTYARVFFDARSWMYALSRFDVVVGARFHGVALGIQAGIPGVLLAIDSRTAELAESSYIPAIHPKNIENVSRESIAQLWSQFDPTHFDQNRITKAREFYTFLKSNMLEGTDHLKRLADI